MKYLLYVPLILILHSQVFADSPSLSQYVNCHNLVKEKVGGQEFDPKKDIRFVTGTRNGKPGIYHFNEDGVQFYSFPKNLPNDKVLFKIKEKGKRNSYLIIEKSESSISYHLSTSDSKSVENYVLNVHKKPILLRDIELTSNPKGLLDDQARSGLTSSEIMQSVDGISSRYGTMKKMKLGDPEKYADWAHKMLAACQNLGLASFQEIVKSELVQMKYEGSEQSKKLKEITGSTQQ